MFIKNKNTVDCCIFGWKALKEKCEKDIFMKIQTLMNTLSSA